VICHPHKILLDEEIKEDDIGWACGTHESEAKCIQGCENLSNATTWKDYVKMNFEELTWE
jgi:hypothetical protein